MTATDFEERMKEKYFTLWLIINKPHPNLHLTGYPYIQGTLALVPIE